MSGMGPVSARKRAVPASVFAKWRVLAQGPGSHIVDVKCTGTEFDEVCVGGWLHLERMDTRQWWMGIETPGGRVHLWLAIGRDGKAKVSITEGKELVRS